MRFPITIKASRKCQRCGLRYPQADNECPHCHGLTDDQLLKIRLRHKSTLAGNENLGRLLFSVAGLLLVLMVIFYLNRG
jgi:hypothetical protein